MEIDGEKIAELVEPNYVDMFWYSYRIIPIDNSVVGSDAVYDNGFWNCHGRLSFRNKEFGILVTAFPAASPLLPDKRVVMRGLYIEAREPNMLENFLLNIKKTFRRYQKNGKIK